MAENGDELDLSLLIGIPGEFVRLLDNELRQPGRQQQQALRAHNALRAHFKMLLQLSGVVDEVDENESTLYANAPKRLRLVHGSDSIAPIASESECGSESAFESWSDGESESYGY